MTLLDTTVETRYIQIGQISDDPATQPREKLDGATIERYADAMAAGQQLPPITVYHDGETYWLADGWHRREAARRLMRASIEAEVRRGTRRDAILFAAGANETHGLPRSNADKRRAVLMLLHDEEWSKWSDHEIARACKVSQPFVSKLRSTLSDNGYQMTQTRLARRGGQVYEQRVRAPEPEPTEAEIEIARDLVVHAISYWKRPANFGYIYNAVQRDPDGGARTTKKAVKAALQRMIQAGSVVEMKDNYNRTVYALAHDPAAGKPEPEPEPDLKQRILDLIAVSPLPAPILCERLGMGDKRAEVDAVLADLKRENRAHEYRSMWFATRDEQRQINDIPGAPSSKPAPEEQPAPASMTPEEVKRAILEALAGGPCDLVARRQSGWLESIHPARFADHIAELIEAGAIRRLGVTGALIGTYEMVPDTAAQSDAWLDQQVNKPAPGDEQPTQTAKDAGRIRELLKKHAPVPLRLKYIREQLDLSEERFTKARMLLLAAGDVAQSGDNLKLVDGRDRATGGQSEEAAVCKAAGAIADLHLALRLFVSLTDADLDELAALPEDRLKDIREQLGEIRSLTSTRLDGTLQRINARLLAPESN